jgi:hypothetical protein
MYSHTRLLFASAVFLLVSSTVIRAGDWPGWRGPTGLGYTDEKDLPLTWNGKKGENIVWKSAIPGGGSKGDFRAPGHSCPIVWKDRVFITTAFWPPEMSDEKERRKVHAAQHVICYQVKDGKQVWDTTIEPGKTVNNDTYNGYAVPTPVTDGKNVFALFASGVIVALDFDGKIVWREELPGLPATDGGFGMSPVLYEDLIIIPGFGKMMGLRALEKATGKLKWEQTKADRNVWTTPALIRIEGKSQLIHYAGGIQSLNPATGETLWFCKGPEVSWASPAYGGGLLYADAGRGGKIGTAVDPTGKGDVSKTHIKWKTDVKGTAGSSPIIVGDYLYRVSDPGVIRCWKVSTGEEQYEERVQNLTPSASPIATPDDRIYFASAKRTYVIKAGPSFEILATNDLEGDQDYTSAAVSEGRIFIKGRSYLWCIGKK